MIRHIRSQKINLGTDEAPAWSPALATLVGTWGCVEDDPVSMVAAVTCDEALLALILADPRNTLVEE